VDPPVFVGIDGFESGWGRPTSSPAPVGSSTQTPTRSTALGTPSTIEYDA